MDTIQPAGRRRVGPLRAAAVAAVISAIGVGGAGLVRPPAVAAMPAEPLTLLVPQPDSAQGSVPISADEERVMAALARVSLPLRTVTVPPLRAVAVFQAGRGDCIFFTRRINDSDVASRAVLDTDVRYYEDLRWPWRRPVAEAVVAELMGAREILPPGMEPPDAARVVFIPRAGQAASMLLAGRVDLVLAGSIRFETTEEFRAGLIRRADMPPLVHAGVRLICRDHPAGRTMVADFENALDALAATDPP